MSATLLSGSTGRSRRRLPGASQKSAASCVVNQWRQPPARAAEPANLGGNPYPGVDDVARLRGRARHGSYPLAVNLQPVRDAYSTMSGQYIGLFDGGWQDHEDDTALVRRHLTGLSGPVFDLGCGPGHWTAYLHSLGAQVTGVDMVPEFIAHARA